MEDSLSFETLLCGARDFAWSALEASSRRQEEVFLLHAGVSIERLAKATLIRKSPFLLMELKGKDDTLFHLTGVREAAKLRTIGAGQAIGRLRDMAVLPQRDPDLDELIELRNGVAHLLASADETFDGLTVLCRVTDQLLGHLDHDQESYWRSWSPLVSITLSDAHEKVEREIARRIEQARHLLKKRFAGLPSETLENYAAVTRSQVPYGLQVSKTHGPKVFIPWKCPACTHPAVIVAGPPVLVRQGEAGDSQPESLTCFVCQFTLKSYEMEAAGVPPHLPLVDDDGARLLTDVEEYLWHLNPSGEELMAGD
ncbi:hypothetical protein ACWGIA_11065 [Streptomyces bobili]